MLKRFSANFALFSISFDGLTVVSSLWLALHLRPLIDGRLETRVDPLFYLLLSVIWVIVNLVAALYENKRNLFFISEALRLLASSLAASLAMAGVAFFIQHNLPRGEFLLFTLIGTSLQLGWRMGMRIYWRIRPQKDETTQRVLILGAGNTGQKIVDALHKQSKARHPVIRYLDDSPEEQARPEVLGPISALREVLTRFPADDIIIALPLEAHEKITDAVISVRTRPVNVWMVPASHRLALYRASIEDLSGLPLLDLRAPALSPQQRLVKRAFDLVFSGLILFLLSIPMLIVALLIKRDSPGPALFRQKRVGENGKVFEMLKFRTMVQNAETLRQTVEKTDANGNLIHKHADDPRITRLGRFLRHYSLDELPQFINVLRGEMSVVGPRPELPYLVERYDAWQYIRFTAPPGVTGWWQINGRSDAPMHLNTEKDIFYIKNYSFWLDLQILARTIQVVISGRGAY